MCVVPCTHLHPPPLQLARTTEEVELLRWERAQSIRYCAHMQALLLNAADTKNAEAAAAAGSGGVFLHQGSVALAAVGSGGSGSSYSSAIGSGADSSGGSGSGGGSGGGSGSGVHAFASSLRARVHAALLRRCAARFARLQDDAQRKFAALPPKANMPAMQRVA